MRRRDRMKKLISFGIVALTFYCLFLNDVNGENTDYKIDPERPEVSVMRGETIDSHFNLFNTGNETLNGNLIVNQFECAHHCPTIEILSPTFITVRPNESTRIEFRIKSYWRNDVQKLPFHIRVIDFEGGNFTIDIIVFVEHNYYHYSICFLVSTSFLIVLGVTIIKIRKRKRKREN